MKNKTAIHFFSKMDSSFSGLVWETINGVLYRKILSPDSSGKPMPVENYFLLVVVERIPTLRESSCQWLEKGFETK